MPSAAPTGLRPRHHQGHAFAFEPAQRGWKSAYLVVQVDLLHRASDLANELLKDWPLA